MFIKFEDIRKFFEIKIEASVVLTLFVCLLLSLLAWRRRRFYYLSWKISGPLYKPFVGNLFDFGFSTQAVYDKLHEHQEKYNHLSRGWFGPIMGIVASDPEDVQILLKHEHSQKKPFVYKFPKDWVGEGILTAETHIWRKHRKLIVQAFNRKVLDHYMEIFIKQSNILVDQIAPHCGTDKNIDVFHYISRCTLDIICEASMGIKINAQKGDEFSDLYLNSTRKIFKVLYTRVMKMWYMWDPIFNMSSLKREYMECVNVLNVLTDKIIESKRGSMGSEMVQSEQKSFVDQLFYQASIDGKNWTPAEIKDEISSMIAAGGDTTSHTFCFVIILLAIFPEVQEKVFQEVLSVDEMSDDDGLEISMEACGKMTYTEQVIKESLRLFPAAPIIGRQCTGDIKIKTKDLVIPKGTMLIIGISMLHRSKKFWGPDADKFNPENFSKENVANRNPNHYVAFSGGPRACVGYKFAMLSMKVLLCKILKAYKLETDEKYEDVKCEFHLLIDKVGGWRVKLQPRY